MTSARRPYLVELPNEHRDVEWFDTEEQAELYAAATDGNATDDLGAVGSHMWLTRIRQQIRDAAGPANTEYIERLLDTKPKP